MLGAMPSVLVLLGIEWALMVFFFAKPDIDSVPDTLSTEDDDSKNHWTKKARLTVALSLLSVALWCTLPLGLEGVLGKTSIVSLIPTVAFLVTGVLTLKEFQESIPWNVLILLMGGHVLGAAVKSSSLLVIAADALAAALPADVSQVAAMFVLCLFSAIVATFISHTVSALILLPIIQEVMTVLFPDSPLAPKLCVFLAGLANSGAAGLPVSSFPNVATTSVLNEEGEAYISPSRLSAVGFPLSFLNLFVSFTLASIIGYLIF
eukprot:gnl/Ergobibamus_cyprinoides/376.p2 GENE.gnl/Ergobibamus_cyprinoides/376~~gnl/Ergobibamus_cyprinoides/376.p2  ORF type:complete len:263 (+),score=90.94 gnl/Ergobibamus_cyprinoides/376:876-1664(+)